MSTYLKNPATQRWLALLVIALLVLSRVPDLIIHPRFWIEEGKVYYAYALSHSWLEALFASHKDYFSLIDNVVTVIAARWLPIRYAPILTTDIGFLCIMLPHIILWFGQSDYWQEPWQKVLASALILFVSQHCGIWLTVVGAQFHLSLAGFFILMENWDGRSRRCITAYAAIVTVTALSSIPFCLAAPFFLIKAATARTRPGWLLSALLLSGCCVQGGIILMHYLDLAHGTLYWDPETTLFTYIIKALFLGYGDNVYAPQSITWPWTLGCMALLLAYFSWPLKPLPRVFFIGSCLTYYVLGCAFAPNSVSADRYFYVPNVILMLLVLQSVRLSGGRRSTIALFTLTAALIAGGRSYYDYHCYNPTWPVWAIEVQLWEHDNERWIAIHPPLDKHRIKIPPQWAHPK